MALIEPERVRALFPELPDLSAVQELLEAVSGLTIDALPAPEHTLDEFAGMAGISDEGVASGYVGFDNFARSVCSARQEALRDIFRRSGSTCDHTEQLLEVTWPVLVERVQQLCARTLVAVMHVLREHGQLRGETSEDRYRYFCLLSATPEFADVLVRVFPELAAQIECVASGLTSAVAAFVARLDEAIAAGSLQEMIGAEARLCGLQWAGSDVHARGQSVLVAEFGRAGRVVYKPRPMAAEAAFGELVRRFNRHAGTDLPVLRIVPGAGHGWQEHADGVRTDDAETYYRHSGHLLAILHLLGASDMHYENVLNHRGAPVVVDAETLFSVNMRRSEGPGSVDPAMVVLAESVFSTGFLPSRIDTADGATDSVDIGFLGYEPGQRAITASVAFREAGTDRMYVDFDLGEILAASPLPVVDAITHEPHFLAEAFSGLYDWITDHRSTVAAWIEELFTGVHVRAVLDNTRKYYQLLSLATHPQFQMSPGLTEALLHRCGIGRVDHVTPALIRAEIRDLRHRDIPYFTLRTDCTEVFDSRGGAVADTLARPPMAQLLDHLQRMSPTRRDLNTRIIRSTFVDRTSPELDRPHWPPIHRSPRGPGPVPRRVDLQVVRDIADEYVRFAIDGADGGPTQWLGSTLSNTVQAHPWRFRQLGDGLYAGRAGLALFLVAAGQRFGDDRYIDRAEAFLLPRADQLLADPDHRREHILGGFGNGYPSIAYVLINGGRMTGRSQWETAGLRLWSAIPDDIHLLQQTDQLMGSAGLLTLSSRLLADPSTPAAHRRQVEQAAAASYGALCANAKELRPDGADRGRIYSGYAHGLAGLISALTTYGQHHRAARDRAHRLEEEFTAHFEEGPVPWAISTDAPDRRAHGWCHGAPGILVGEQVRHVHGHQDRGAVIDALIALVWDECLDLNLSLCHGDVGNLMILQQAARLRNDSSLRRSIRGMLGQLAEQIVPRKLAQRNAKSLLNDSLMLGLPGIGYGLLQLEADGALPDPFTYGLVR